MARVECAICRRSKEESDMQIFSPTDEEKEAMRRMGEATPQDRYAYCKGCLHILKSPSGLSFLKGVIQHHVKNFGVKPEMAEKIIDRFTAKLLERSRKLN